MERPTYGMIQYNCEDTSIKAVLKYKFTGNYIDTIRLMLYHNPNEVYNAMAEYSQLDIYYPGSDTYNSIVNSDENSGR